MSHLVNFEVNSWVNLIKSGTSLELRFAQNFLHQLV